MRTPSFRRLCAAVLFAAITAPSLLHAQGSGSIRGTITGAHTTRPLANVRVSIDNPARVVTTAANGTFAIRNIAAGTYDVQVTALGFAPVHKSVEVKGDADATLNLALDDGSLLLSSVIVSATRTPVEARKVASTVNVLTPELVQASPARESQDMLRDIPGVELPRTSSLVGGSAQIVSIRGVDEGRTAVLFDGIPVNDAWGEWIDWGRVPKSMVDRVEVVEGGSSNLYGNGAMGGTISFFSRPLAPGALQMGVEGGDRSLRHVSAGVGFPVVGALSGYATGDYQSGGGYTLLDPLKRGAVDVPSQIIQRNAFARLTYAPSSALSVFVSGHKYSDNRATGTAMTFTTRDQGTVDAGADIGRFDSGRWSLRAWTGGLDERQRASTIRTGRVAEDSSVVAKIPSHDWGGSAQWTRTNVLGLESISAGADYRHYNGAYDEVDFNTSCPGTNCGKLTRTIWSGGDQSLSGVFVQAIAAPVAKLRVELSARTDRWSNDNGKSVDASAGSVTYANRSKNAFSPRVGAKYQITQTFGVHAAYYKAFRAPNLAELYRKQISTTSITLPNPDLKPEFAAGREAGIDWQPAQWLQAKGTYYIADYSDFNVPVQISAGPPAVRQRLNVNKSRSKGAEAYVVVRPLPALSVSGSVVYDDARVVSGPTGTVVGAHINRVPSPKQNVRVMWDHSTFGTWSAVWRHEGHTTTLQGAWLDPYTVVDASVRRAIVPGVTAQASLENIGNKQYQINLSGSGTSTLISYGMPRTLRVGLEASRF